MTTSLAKAKGGPEIQLLRDAGATENMELKQPLAPFNEESQKALEGASGLTPDEVAALQAAWALLTSAHQPSKSAKTVSDTSLAFFHLMFKNYPAAVELFPFRPSANGGQMDDAGLQKHAVNVFTSVGKTIQLLDDFPTMATVATGLLKRHVKYGVVYPDHYDIVLGTLAEFLAAGLGGLGLWDAQQISAWTKYAGLVRAVGASCYKDVQPAAAAAAEP